MSVNFNHTSRRGMLKLFSFVPLSLGSARGATAAEDAGDGDDIDPDEVEAIGTEPPPTAEPPWAVREARQNLEELLSAADPDDVRHVLSVVKVLGPRQAVRRLLLQGYEDFTTTQVRDLFNCQALEAWREVTHRISLGLPADDAWREFDRRILEYRSVARALEDAQRRHPELFR